MGDKKSLAITNDIDPICQKLKKVSREQRIENIERLKKLGNKKWLQYF